MKTNEAPPPAHVWQDDSAAIPRERPLMWAWWIAIGGALAFIIAATLISPDPYAEILSFIGDGLVVTFQITVVSMTLALLVGLVTGLGRTSQSMWVNVLASLYVEVIRGIPLLAQLFWIYYALARVLRLGPNVSAVLGLTICYGAYIGETFRAGIQSIPKGQMEAARALGLTRAQAMRRVIIPQAIRVILPPVGNEFIAMLKDSSLVSVIAISDLLRRGREYASRTFAYFETYTLVALVYLLVTLIFSRVVFYIEEGMARQPRTEPVDLMHRLAGSVVDIVILNLVGLPVYGLLQALSPGEGMPALPLLAGIMFAIAIVYDLAFWTRAGRTPGMVAVGLRIIAAHSDGAAGIPAAPPARDKDTPPTLRQALQRLLPALLPVPGFGFLWAAPPLGGRPLQDTLSHTLVVHD